MAGKTILIQGETLGRGNEQLGEILMSNFLAKLTENKDKPARLVFWNSGVKLIGEGSWALVHLKKLEEQGVEILACATCLDYFELTGKVKVGKPTNMVKSVEFMLDTDIVCL
jgi:selenium metabolism protein YedF